MSKRRDWRILAESNCIQTQKTSFVNVSLCETLDKDHSGIVNIRKWDKFLKKEEYLAGLQREEMPSRPTTQGLLVPFTCIPELIKELQQIYNYALINNISADSNSLPFSKSKSLANGGV